MLDTIAMGIYFMTLLLFFMVLLPTVYKTIDLSHAKYRQLEWPIRVQYWPHCTPGLNIALFDKKRQYSNVVSGKNRNLLIWDRLMVDYYLK